MSYVLPVIGSSGVFTLSSPFDSKVQPGERLFCKSIRSLSDYLANNEKPFDDIYKPVGLEQSDFDEDVAEDMHIVSLQNGEGYWVYVPAKYIVNYPVVNGVPYTYRSLAVALPALPIDLSSSQIETAIQNVINDLLGVDCVIRTIETSREIMVTDSIHNQRETERFVRMNGNTTDRARFIRLTQQFNDLQVKYQALETHVINNP